MEKIFLTRIWKSGFSPLILSSKLPIFVRLQVQKETVQQWLHLLQAILGISLVWKWTPNQLYLKQQPHCWFCETFLGACFGLGWGSERMGPIPHIAVCLIFQYWGLLSQLGLVDGLN